MNKKAVALLLGLIVLVIGIAVWQSKSRDVMAGMEDKVSAGLTNFAGCRVTVGEIEVVGYNTVILHNTVVYDKQDQMIAAGDAVKVIYSPLSILLGHNADMVSEVILQRPRFILRQYVSGQWNFEEILQQSSAAELPFKGKMSLTDGSIEINTASAIWALEGVKGTLDFHNKPSVALELAASYQGAPVSVSGAWQQKGAGVLTLKARQLAIAPLNELIQSDVLHLVDGTAENITVTMERSDEDIRFAGEAKLVDAVVELGGVKVEGLQGPVTFTDEKLYLFNSAYVYGQPLKVRGWVTINTPEPVFALAVSSQDFDPAAIDDTLPVRGSIAFDAYVSGTPAVPQITGEVRLKEGQLSGYHIDNAVANLAYADTILTVDKFSGDIMGGSVRASGVVDIAKQTYQGHAEGRQIDSALLSDWIPDLGSKLDINVDVAGHGTSLEGATVYGTASLAAGQYKGVAFDGAQTGFYIAGNSVTVDYLNISRGPGMVTLNGNIDGEKLQLAVIGRSLPLDALAAQISDIPMEGMVNVSGTVTGTIASPQLALQFEAVNGQVFYQPFQTASGSIQVVGDKAILSNIELMDGATRHRLQGTVGLTGENQMDVVLISTAARAENLVKLIAPGEKLTGNVDNEIQLTGPLKQLNANGSITLTEGSYRGYLIAKGQGTYHREQGVTTINDFVIHSLNTEIKLSGTINPNDELDFNVAASNIDVDRLHLDLPYPVTGRAKFEGKLNGTSANPVFSGELSADSFMIKDKEIKNIAGYLTVTGSEVDVPRLGFTQGNGTYHFSGGFNAAAGRIYGNVDVEKGDLALLFGLLNMPDKEVSGRMDAHILLSGTLSRPDICLTGSVSNGKIRNYPLEKIDVDVALNNNIVTVNKLTARQGQGVLAVRGTADLNGPLNLEAGGRDIDAGIITALWGMELDAKGKLNFGSQISGTAHNPHAAVSLEISGGGVGSATFDSVYGLFIVDNQSINVNQLLVTKGPYRASAYGIVPMAALSDQGRQHASDVDQMNLKVRLDEANLSILPLLTKEVDWAAGPTHGEITVSGTLLQPYLSGRISVKDGAVKLTKFADPIQKVDLDIQLEGDTINLHRFSGHMGSGGFVMTGSAGISGLGLSRYDFALNVDKLGVDNKYFKGPLSANLALAKLGGKPKLSGQVLLERDMINIPYMEFEPSTLDVALDVELVVGSKVRLYNPYMYDIWAEGKVKFGGSTLRPNTSGRITALRGTVNYLRTPFKVREGSAEFIQFGSFEPVIRLNADTRLQNTVIELDVNGPLSAMEFTLTSDPAMSQESLISLLTLRSRYFEKQQNSSGAGRDSELGRDELVGLLDAGLQMRFLSEVEGVLRDALGLDDFRLVRDTVWFDAGRKTGRDRDTPAGREVYSIEMSKYINDKLMLSYKMGLDNDRHSAAFRYDFNKKFSFTGSFDDQSRGRLGLETRFSF